jgi:hypothetical protein
MGVLLFVVKQGHQVVVPACHTDFKLALTHHQLHILLQIQLLDLMLRLWLMDLFKLVLSRLMRFECVLKWSVNLTLANIHRPIVVL